MERSPSALTLWALHPSKVSWAALRAPTASAISLFLNSTSPAHSTCCLAQRLSWVSYSSTTSFLKSSNILVMASSGPPAFILASIWVRRVIMLLFGEKFNGYLSYKVNLTAVALARSTIRQITTAFIFFIFFQNWFLLIFFVLFWF